MAALGWGLDAYGAATGQQGTAASVASVAAGVATITGLARMGTAAVGRTISFRGATSPSNNGDFVIVEYVSAVSVKIANINAVAPDVNNGSIQWIERLTDASRYGSSVAGLGISVVSALALTTNTVRVTLSGEPKHASSFSQGDALNPSTWSIQRLDTAEFMFPIGVTPYTPLVYDVLVLQPFGAASVIHRISSSTLQDLVGQVLHAPRQADFAGLLGANVAKTGQARSQSVDLFNQPTPEIGGFGTGGTLAVTAAGDYEEMSGAALVKKLIIRRLISKPGDFFHLPTYGVGLREKEPIPAGDLARLKAQIERQVLQEPEVASASAKLTQSSDTLLVQIRAKLKVTGQSLDVSLPIRQDSVSL